mgnify:CR=1 FL=1
MAEINALDKDQVLFKPAPDAWSINEILEHLNKANESMRKVVISTLERAASGKKVGTGRTDLAGVDILKRVVEDYSKPVEAPEIVRPLGKKDWEENLREFNAFFDRLFEDWPLFNEEELKRYVFPHPIYRKIDLMQWLWVIAGHCLFHLLQIKDNKKSPDYPV